MFTANAAPKTAMQRFLDGVEKVGNMVPHPVVIFLILIAIVIALSAMLGMFGAAVSFERINPDTHQVDIASTASEMCATRQAEYLALDDFGRLTPGRSASFVVLDRSLQLKAVWMRGVQLGSVDKG